MSSFLLGSFVLPSLNSSRPQLKQALAYHDMNCSNHPPSFHMQTLEETNLETSGRKRELPRNLRNLKAKGNDLSMKP